MAQSKLFFLIWWNTSTVQRRVNLNVVFFFFFYIFQNNELYLEESEILVEIDLASDNGVAIGL